MKTALSILTIAVFAAFLYSGNDQRPMTESYRQKRIDALTRIKNEMKISNANVTQLELEIIEDQIAALQNGIEIERNEIGPEIITVSP